MTESGLSFITRSSNASMTIWIPVCELREVVRATKPTLTALPGLILCRLGLILSVYRPGLPCLGERTNLVSYRRFKDSRYPQNYWRLCLRGTLPARPKAENVENREEE